MARLLDSTVNISERPALSKCKVCGGIPHLCEMPWVPWFEIQCIQRETETVHLIVGAPSVAKAEELWALLNQYAEGPKPVLEQDFSRCPNCACQVFQLWHPKACGCGQLLIWKKNAT